MCLRPFNYYVYNSIGKYDVSNSRRLCNNVFYLYTQNDDFGKKSVFPFKQYVENENQENKHFS